MRRNILNLFALLVIGLGGSYLGGVDSAAAATCSGPAGAGGCTCTSGDGKYTCTGDSCSSTATGCSAQDAEVEAPTDG